MTYHQVCDKSNKTGATRRAGIGNLALTTYKLEVEVVDNKAMERLLENLSIPKLDNANFQSGNRGIIMLLSS